MGTGGSYVRMMFERTAIALLIACYAATSTRPIAQDARGGSVADGALLEEVNSAISSRIAALGHHGRARVAAGPTCATIDGPRCAQGERCNINTENPESSECQMAIDDNGYKKDEAVQIASPVDGKPSWKPAKIDTEGSKSGDGYKIAGEDTEFDKDKIRVLMPGDVVETADGEGTKRATFLKFQNDGKIALKWSDTDQEADVDPETVNAVDYTIVQQEQAAAKAAVEKDRVKKPAEKVEPTHKEKEEEQAIVGREHVDLQVKKSLQEADKLLKDNNANPSELRAALKNAETGVDQAVLEMNGQEQKEHQMAFKVKQKEMETDKLVRDAEYEKARNTRPTKEEMEVARKKQEEVITLQERLEKDLAENKKLKEESHA